MRTDYFTSGPPWKFIFEDSLGFRYTLCVNNYKDPPEYYKFFIDKNDVKQGIVELKLTRIFKMVGKLGNTVAYRED